jgi:AcrR family transcriptional regulator
MRADAQRNREAIICAALEAFQEKGVLASLDGIAMRAGVGNATLYRKFPTRDDLLAALLAPSLEELLITAKNLYESLPAREALTEWLFRLTWELRAWRDLPQCIAAAKNDADSSLYPTCAQLLAETGNFLDKAKGEGLAVDSVTATDLFELVTTLSWGVDRYGDNEQCARRRVTIATIGIFRVA